MKISFYKIITFVIVFFLLIVFWLGLQKDNSYNTKSLVGTTLSSFNLPSINNEDAITENYLKNNKFTIINFFASWCAPCRIEHKYLLNLSNNGIKIIGVNFKDKKENALQFLNELGNPYEFVAQDVDGKASISFGIYGIPESIIVNDKLIVIKKVIGPINQQIYEEILENLK